MEAGLEAGGAAFVVTTQANGRLSARLPVESQAQPRRNLSGEKTMSTLQLQGQQLFDNVYRQFSDYQVAQGLADLFQGLFDLRRAAAADEWREFAQQTWLAHPLRALAHQDPITRRAFEKPRGYAGDAELIDMIYGRRKLPRMSSVGAALYSHVFQAPAPQAVRARRDHLAA